MKNFSFIKLLSVLTVLTVLSLQSFAADVYNKLSEIMITKSDDYTYNLNFVFNNDFKGHAFMRTPSVGQYSIFLPDSEKLRRNVKIKNMAKKMPKIKVSVEENPYVKDNVESSYLKVNVKTDPDYSINLISQKAKQPAPFDIAAKIVINMLTVIVLIAAITSYFVFYRKKEKNSYTVFPVRYNDELKNKQKEDKDYNNTPEVTNPVTSGEKSFNSSDSKNFKCFDIVREELKPQNKNYKIQSSIKQTSVITNVLKNTAKLSQAQNIMEDSSKFEMPYADETIKKEENREIQQQEFLSLLNITPSKGFYLTEEDNLFCLFGFTGGKRFLLKKFNDLQQINLQARFYDQNSKSDIYIVRLDTYKAMIEISGSEMKELAVL